MTEAEMQLKRYQTLMKNALDGVHIIDIHGDIVEVNDAFCDMLGYSQEEANKLNLADLDSQWTKEELLEKLKNFAGVSARFETVHRRKDGKLIDVEISATGVDIDGQPYVFASSRNITDQKQMEHSLKLAQYSVDHAQDAIFRLNENAQILYVNDAACHHLGYAKNELLNLSVLDIDPAISMEIWRKNWEGTASAGWRRFETFQKRKDGTLVPVEVVANYVKFDGESIFTSFARDITERKAGESKISRLTQLYAALSQCNDAIVRCTCEEELFPIICQDAVQFGGMKMAWIGMVDPKDKQVKPVAFYGFGTEYLNEIEVSIDADDPFGTAIRENRPFWCQDFEHDPALTPWRERGKEVGWKAIAALPLLRNGAPVGILALYSDTANVFDEDARHLLIEMAANINFALGNFEHAFHRKQVQEEIKLKNIILQTQQETSLDALLIVDENQQIMSYNQQFITMWRFPSMPVGAGAHEDVIQLIAGQARNTEEHLARVRHMFESRELKSRIEINLKDGRIIDRYSAPINGEDGKYYGRVSYFRDITESRKSEQKLIESEQRFRGLVEQSLAGIYIIQHGKLVYVNPRAAEIFGQGSVADLVGRDPLEFITKVHHGKVTESVRQLVKKEVSSITAEFEVLRKDGVTVFIGANASLATYHDLPAIIGLIQDISEKTHTEEQIMRYVEQLNAAFLGTVKMVTSLGEMRDPYTAGHERRVAEIAVAIAKVLGLDEQSLEGIKVAGYLHDIGKISIPAEILVKPGRLSLTEYALVKEHAQASYDVLKHVEFPWPVAVVALQHHERMDGSGYPNGLKGDEILLESRIMAVADVVEAMASHRPYRAGLGIDKALAEIERGSGTIYDPVAVDACLRLFREQGYVLPAY